ncbi:MAG: hypothetical protein JRH15_20870 [Deltaproteobacteria bacterium]|nr:hypothetical protein [Deltaproteobacteria bacterium]
MKINTERKYILICGAVLLLIGLFYRFSPGIIDTIAVTDDLILKEKQVNKYLQLIEAEKQLNTQLVQMKRHLGKTEASLFNADSASMAAVQLQGIIKKVADLEGIEIESMRFMDPEIVDKTAADPFLSIPVKFSFKSPMRALANLLYRIHNDLKSLNIKELRIKTKGKYQTELVRTTLVVNGYMAQSSGISK